MEGGRTLYDDNDKKWYGEHLQIPQLQFLKKKFKSFCFLPLLQCLRKTLMFASDCTIFIQRTDPDLRI